MRRVRCLLIVLLALSAVAVSVANDDDNGEDGKENGSTNDGDGTGIDNPGWPVTFAPKAELINGIDDIKPAGEHTRLVSDTNVA
jgi:hypothetical protein